MHTPLATLETFTIAYTESDLIGKLIILSLIFLSIVCWVVLLFKIWQTKHVKRTSAAFQIALEKNKEHLLSLDIEHLPRPLNKNIPNPFAEIFSVLKTKTLETLNKKLFFLEKEMKENRRHEPLYLSLNDLELVETHVLTTISLQNKILEKHLFILSTIVTLAPFLGLLGTVWGILVTFSELHAGGGSGSNSAILGGLSTALSTTVLGLVIAIPALVSYNYLKNTLRNLSSDMEDFLFTLLSTIELQYRKVDI